jgi:hypothetical protein
MCKNDNYSCKIVFLYRCRYDKMYQTYQVLGTNSLTINSLKSSQTYYFTIDSFNESGVTKGEKIIELK